MAGNKGFTNRAKSGKVAQQARIARFVEREKTAGKKFPRPAAAAKPARRAARSRSSA